MHWGELHLQCIITGYEEAKLISGFQFGGYMFLVYLMTVSKFSLELEWNSWSSISGYNNYKHTHTHTHTLSYFNLYQPFSSSKYKWFNPEVRTTSRGGEVAPKMEWYEQRRSRWGQGNSLKRSKAKGGCLSTAALNSNVCTDNLHLIYRSISAAIC